MLFRYKYLYWEDARPDYVEPYENAPQDFFVHVQGKGSSGEAFAQAEEVFGDIKRLIRKGEKEGEAGFTVKALGQGQFEEKAAALVQKGVTLLGRIILSEY